VTTAAMIAVAGHGHGGGPHRQCRALPMAKSVGLCLPTVNSFGIDFEIFATHSHQEGGEIPQLTYRIERFTTEGSGRGIKKQDPLIECFARMFRTFSRSFDSRL
jgi:hypothetical protein